MKTPLRALLVEDNPRDAELLLLELRRGYQVTFERVETAEEMGKALDREPWQIVISDYALPAFNALGALAVVKARGLDVPFIIVSGTIGEETAVEAMRAGAHDFLTKDKFARLLPAIDRELREASGRAERRKIQEQLMISDRMASIGTLAAGVAHEINNPLAALIGSLDFLSHSLVELLDDAPAAATVNPGAAELRAWLAKKVEELNDPLRDARVCADRVRMIVRDLKIFSRSADEDQAGPVDVTRVIESSLRMASNEIRHRARLVRDFGEVPLVQANEARLGQVFLNLIVNAAQAIPEGRVDRHEIRITTRLDEAANRVVVEIRDSGSGIAPEHLPRLFTPFFTTKAPGLGTGLGLSICHRIVTGLGGRIEVESEVGKGTTFRTWLPVAVAEEAVEPAAAPPVPARTRRGKLLVVDDEPIIAVSIRRMLQPEHDVVALPTVREALDRIGKGDRFDVILTDLMMPQMTGMDFHAELRAVAPDQAERMIFMTGGAFTEHARSFLAGVRNPRIDKPFEWTNLRHLIQGMLA